MFNNFVNLMFLKLIMFMIILTMNMVYCFIRVFSICALFLVLPLALRWDGFHRRDLTMERLFVWI